MEIEGKIIAVIPPREGVSARTGTAWKTQDYVIETHDQYPRRCCFNVFGADKIQLFNIQVGEELRVSFDIDAHEYQGRWFNSIRAWKVERVAGGAAASEAAPAARQDSVAAPFPSQPEAPADFAATDDKDDLPF